jgi:hypothetical protein
MTLHFPDEVAAVTRDLPVRTLRPLETIFGPARPT